MTHKQLLIDQLNKCLNIVKGEVWLLDSWGIDAGITTGRAAECRIAARYLSIGESSSLVSVSRIWEAAGALNEASVISSPSSHSVSLTAALESSLGFRSALNPSDFLPGPAGQLQFELAIEMSKDNGVHAADSAASLLNECLHV